MQGKFNFLGLMAFWYKAICFKMTISFETKSKQKQNQNKTQKQIYSFSAREVNKNNLLGGQFLVFLPKNPEK